MKIHSEVNLITNSSSELFVVLTEASTDESPVSILADLFKTLVNKLEADEIFSETYKTKALLYFKEQADFYARAEEHVKANLEEDSLEDYLNENDSLEFEGKTIDNDDSIVRNGEYDVIYNGEYVILLQALLLAESKEIYN